MRLGRSLAVVAAVGAFGAPAMAQQADQGQTALRLLQKLAGQYAIVMARTFVDLTYDALTIEPGTGNMVISGLTLYPELEWDPTGQCAIKVDRVDTGDITSFETLQTTIQVSGAHVPVECLDPEIGGMVAAFGYDQGLTADTMAIEIAYDLPSAGAEITVQASVIDAADISIAATFDYLWFRVPIDDPDDEPQPVAYLGEAEIAIENNGLWERLEPMVAQQMGGDVNAIPPMLNMMGGQMLGEGGEPSPEAAAFLENLSGELGRFLTEKNRLVVTIAPEESVLLGPEAFQSPSDAIAILKPEVSGVPVAYRRMILPEELNAALGGGSGLDDAARLRVGKALVTGVGAPRSVIEGEALLQPLADDWNGAAALLLAESRADIGDHAGAYAMAMRALAGGEARAIAVADAAEAEIGVAAMLASQRAEADAWPGEGALEAEHNALIAAGDVPGLRRLAYRASVGKDMPRDVVAAYYLASLAAAGGDKGAANLRKRLDRRFGAEDGDAWRSAAAEAASLAVRTWTSGLGATIAERLQ